MQLDRKKALDMMQKGASYIEVVEATGVNIKTLRSWKARYLRPTPTTTIAKPKPVQAKPKANPKPVRQDEMVAVTESYGALEQRYNAAMSDVEHLKTSNDAILQSYDETLRELTTLQQRHATLTEQCANDDHDRPNNTPLIVAIVSLHISAVYGVGEVLSEVFHTYVMGYLTAGVFVSSGLIIFLTKRFSVGVSWVVLLATFVLESYCNYLTIYMRMSGDELAKFQQYTNTGLLFFIIAVFVPLVNLALEYLLFTKPQAGTYQT